MKYLILSILASICILILFRWMHSNGANTRHAITTNYLVATATGTVLYTPTGAILTTPWFWPASILGIMFYVIFRLIATTTQVNGVAIAGIATKMSVVIPVCFGFVLFNEEVTVLKLAGVGTGLFAVLLSASKGARVQNWKWPVIAFFATGMLDASLNIFQSWSVSEAQFPSFLTTIFGFAFLAGVIHYLSVPDKHIRAISVMYGSVLGVINFGAVYFILRALAQPNLESSVVFPINHFAVVALSAVCGVVLFKERLSVYGWLGLGLALVSITLLYLG
jgi:drug/metabolite transporter (DMT)-like permease